MRLPFAKAATVVGRVAPCSGGRRLFLTRSIRCWPARCFIVDLPLSQRFLLARRPRNGDGPGRRWRVLP